VKNKSGKQGATMNDSGKLPWVKFSYDDYTNDVPLSRCSMGAQGLWMRMLGMMHHGEPYGHLQTMGGPIGLSELASRVGMGGKLGVKMVTKWVRELDKFGVSSRTKNGVIYSRRMVRDESIRLINRQNGIMGGNPKLLNSVNPPLKPRLNHPVKPPLIPRSRGVEVKKRQEPLTPPSGDSATPPGPSLKQTPRQRGDNPRAVGDNPRARGDSPRQQKKRELDEWRKTQERSAIAKYNQPPPPGEEITPEFIEQSRRERMGLLLEAPEAEMAVA
jgi:hypothetical protein